MFVPTGPPGLPGVPGMNCSCDLTGRVSRAAGTFGGLAGSNGRIEGRGEIAVHIMHCVIFSTSGMFTCLTSFTIYFSCIVSCIMQGKVHYQYTCSLQIL